MIGEQLDAVAQALRHAAHRRGMDDSPGWATLLHTLDIDHPAENLSQTDDPADPTGPDALAGIAAVFGLNPVEADLLLIAAAPDLDPAIATAYGILLGADGPRPASVALALELAGVPLLSGRGRAMLSRTGPLRRWDLVQLAPGSLLLARALTAGEDVIGTLLGHPVGDPLSDAMAVDSGAVADSGLVTDNPGPAAAEVTAALTAGEPLIWVEDPAGASGLTTTVAGFDAAGLNSAVFDLSRRPADESLTAAVLAMIRRAGLQSSGLIVTSAELLAGSPAAAQVVGMLTDAPLPVALIGRSRWNPAWHPALPVVVRATALTPGERVDRWRRHLSADDVPSSALAAYRLSPEQIDAAGEHLARSAALRGQRPDGHLVAETVRLLGGSHRIRSGGWTRTGFDDLQLPTDTLATLQRLAEWVRLRDEVIGRGQVQGMGGKGTGIAALFTGSPGTGKTLAAHVIADTAGLDLMQVDLSGVIDKYIGETEKNLERIFAEAESLNVVLFFDEADALFGSRSAVKDARDRYANQEVSYLLQRMEHFDGITVLATNLRGNLDPAFSRRMHFIVHFPDPDVDTRRRLWEQLLTQAGELDPVDPVDLAHLAATVELAGGDLRNIVLAGTYDAAIESAPLGHRHLVAATLREYTKLGRRAPVGL